MAVELMRQETPYRGDGRYAHAATVTDTTSNALLMPEVARQIAVAVQPGTSASVQFTISPLAEVEAETAIWETWPAGAVAVPTSDSLLAAVTALRLVSIGASTWQVRV